MVKFDPGRLSVGFLVLCACAGNSSNDKRVQPPPPDQACMGDGTRVALDAVSADGDWARSIAPYTQQVSSNTVSWSCTPAERCSTRTPTTLQLTLEPKDQETCAIYDCDRAHLAVRGQSLSQRAKYCTRSLARSITVQLRSDDGSVSFASEATLISAKMGHAKISAVIGDNLLDPVADDPSLAKRLGVDPSWRVQQDVDLVLDAKKTRGDLNIMLTNLHPPPGQMKGQGGWHASWSTPRASAP